MVKCFAHNDKSLVQFQLGVIKRDVMVNIFILGMNYIGSNPIVQKNV